MTIAEEAGRAVVAEAAIRRLKSAGLFFAESFQAESDRWFLWAPVLVGAGIAAYFALSFEPPLWVCFLLPCIALAILVLAMRRDTFPLAAAGLLCVTIGLGTASLRTWSVAAPILGKEWTGTLEGTVVSTELTETGALSVIVAPVTMQDRKGPLSTSQLPARVRVNIRQKDVSLEPGETIRLKAQLMPPPEPVQPGGFDYARQVFFESLGGVGYAFTAPEHLADAPNDLATGLATGLERLRHSITARIQNGIGGGSGAVAAALVTGEQRAIPKQAVDDLRNAGLSHVLSISGLHMVLFGGSLFWLVRAFFALIPSIALRYPIKKWGAAAALLGSTFYLMISGSEVATVRSWIMIALMFVAILLDRPAISLRNVALAALIVLLWTPETLLGASFQMSFSAVVALIAFYETPLVQRWSASARQKDEGLIAGSLRFMGNHLAGILLTTMVAGLATGVFAAFHFDRIAVYGMAGNMGALPICSAIIMPAALAVLILMPFGLDVPALWLMGKGVDGMLYVAHEVSSWQGADRLIASAPLSALMIFTLGGLWLALWRGHWRFIGAAGMLLGIALWNSGPRPDVLIDRDGALSAMRVADGTLALTASRPSYTAEQWLRHDGDERLPAMAAKTGKILCDAVGCAYREEGRPRIAFAESLDAIADDCAIAEIIVARIPVPHAVKKTCRARLVIDRFDLWREGAMALYFDEDGKIRVESSRQMRGDRPWVLRRGRSSDQ